MRRAWSAAILVLAGAIVAASLAPQLPESVDTFSDSDKAWHFLAYLLLALAGSAIAAPQRLWRTMLRCFLLGAALELAQGTLTATRSPEWTDLAANSAGIAVAWLIAGWGRAGWGLRAGAWIAGRLGR
ncbi:MAG: VanZ family protein [Gammaproteobacteria bacterium]|nr:VanZ family protein [Gammaproteobacteria bacterium]